jgi:hypothetical protein
MMRRLLIAAVIGLPIAASAQTAPAGTNFPSLENYPGPACIKAGELPRKPDSRTL